MKFTVSSTALSSSLQSISRVISTKNTLPILDNFLLKITGNELLLTASDLETTLTTSVEISEVTGEGSVAISAKLLLDTLKEFSEQPLTFDINDDDMSITMTSAFGKYNFVGQIGEEYPSLPEMLEDKNMLTLPVDVLLNGINKTLFAAATDEMRPTMTGVFFDIRQDNVTFVATDAHKLVRFRSMALQPDLVANFILPQKPSGILKTILPKENGDVVIEFDGKNVAFTLSHYKMFCRQIEGRFPNYENVIPKQEDNVNKIVVDRVSLINALRRVSLFTNQANNLIKLSLNDNALNISAQDIDFSISAEETLECQYSGQPLTIGFKSQFLIEILNNISATEVSIELSDPSRAGLILPFEQNEDEHLLMLLMPMLLND